MDKYIEKPSDSQQKTKYYIIYNHSIKERLNKEREYIWDFIRTSILIDNTSKETGLYFALTTLNIYTYITYHIYLDRITLLITHTTQQTTKPQNTWRAKKFIVMLSYLILSGLLSVLFLIMGEQIILIYSPTDNLYTQRENNRIFIYLGLYLLVIGNILIRAYPWWKRIIKRSIGLIYSAILGYLFLTQLLEIDESIARILVGSIGLGALIIHFPSRYSKGLLLTTIITSVGLLLFASIPVYTKTVNFSIFVQQQPTRIRAINDETTDLDETAAIIVYTKNKKNVFTIDWLSWQEPITFDPNIERIQYTATQSNINNPIMVQLPNSDRIILYPQSSIGIKQDILRNSIHHRAWHAAYISTQGMSIIHTTTKSWATYTGMQIQDNNLTWLSYQQIADATQTMEIYHETLQWFSKEFFGRNFSQTSLRERLILYKMEILTLWDNDNQILLDNFHRYRYLTYGIKPPYNLQEEHLWIPQETVEQNNRLVEIDNNDTLQEWVDIWWWRTRLLQSRFGR